VPPRLMTVVTRGGAIMSKRKSGKEGSVPRHRMLTVDDLMERLQLSAAACYRLMNRLPGRVLIGKSVRVPEAALDAFLASGGDLADERGTTSSIFAERPARVTVAGSAEPKSNRCTTRTKHWLSKLRSSSHAETDAQRSVREQEESE
jgi:predicted DNA-binding transcriptional regulator AlpA